MPTLVPMHTIIVARPHPKGMKDKEGNVVHESITPKIGEPFDFTDEEADDIRASSPLSLRDPVNEGGEAKEDSDVDTAVREAHEEAIRTRTAAGDARETARAGAVGRGARKQPDNSGAAETKQTDNSGVKLNDDDEL